VVNVINVFTEIIILQHPNPTDNDQFGNNFTDENR